MEFTVTRANNSTYKLPSKGSKIVSASQSRTLMGEDIVSMSVESVGYIDFKIGDWITVYGYRYTLNSLGEPERIGENTFSYNLEFEGLSYELTKVMFRSADFTGFNPSSEFSLTGTLEKFLDVLNYNLERKYGVGVWAVGSFPATEAKTLSFNSENCLLVLNTLCTEFNIEYKVTTVSGVNTISLGEFSNVLPIQLEYGKGKGLYSLVRTNVDSKNIITRLYAEGSDKNIKVGYRDNALRLRMGVNSESYIDSPSISSFGIVEGAKIFDDVFPHREGTISAIDATDKTKFVDSSMNFDLAETDTNGTKWLLPGASAKIHFNSGNLAGYAFDLVDYKHATKTFRIKPFKDDRGLEFPNDSAAFQFKKGDKYVILNIIMPQAYITTAESELLSKAQEYLSQNDQPRVEYNLTLDRFFLQRTFSGGGFQTNVIEVGDYLHLKDSKIGVDKNVRVKSFIRDGNDPWSYEVSLSDVIEPTRIERLISDSLDTKKAARQTKMFDPARSRRNWRDIVEVTEMIDTLKAEVALIGSPEGQFQLDSFFELNKNGNPDLFGTTAGALVHDAYEGTAGSIWNIGVFEATLTQNSPYYLYAKCSKTTTGGILFVSLTKIGVDDDPAYYHFPIGLISSKRDNSRTLTTTYGYTLISGNNISTGIIKNENSGLMINLETGDIQGKFTFTSGKKIEDAIDDAVNDLEIGGRNLVEKTNQGITNIQIDSSAAGATWTRSEETVDGVRCAKGTKNTAAVETWALFNLRIYTPSKFRANKQYAISFKMKPSFAVNNQVTRLSTITNQGLSTNSGTYSLVAGEWNDVKLVVTTLPDFDTILAGGATVNLRLAIVGNSTIGDTVLLKDVMIEEGNKASAYAQAPEDVQVQIDAAQTYEEYSVNGLDNWHYPYASGDIYMRRKIGTSGTWSIPIKIVGKDGTSVNIKGQVSTSANLPASASLGDGYIAEDTGHLWVWTGHWSDAGKIQGDSGANSYIHIAYADDSLGGGFSQNPEGKTWIGMYSDFTSTDSDTPSDYTWMYAKGADGRSIILVDAEFAVNTSASTPPVEASSLWKTNADPVGTGQLWTRTKTIYSNGDSTYSAPANITPKKGDKGQGIDSVTEEYTISTSKTTQPISGWDTTQPPWVQGQYIWSRVKVVYKNPDSTVYTGYSVSSEWEAVNDLEIGGRNLLLGTNTGDWVSWVAASSTTLSSEGILRITSIVSGEFRRAVQSIFKNRKSKFISGETYTLSFYVRGTIVGKSINYVYLMNTGVTNQLLHSLSDDRYIDSETEFKKIKTTFIANANASNSTGSYILIGHHGEQDVGDWFEIKDLKIEKGNKATDWSPAPEDVDAEIATAKQEALTAAGNAQTAANSANTAVGNLSGYVDGAFKDGVVDTAEAKAIEKYKNSLAETKLSVDGAYAQLYNSTYLEGSAKSNLSSAKGALNSAYTSLVTSIDNAIADGKTTAAEKTDVDSKFGLFNTAMATYQVRAEEANSAINVKLDDIAKGYVDAIEVGGQNLALETNQGTKNWHWSMQVGGFTATEHIEDGVSGCKLTRNSTPHSGWNFASYSKIGRDKLERGETYMITLDVFTNKASTLLLFFRTGNFQYELISSWDYKNNTCTANTWSRIVLKATLLQTFPPETNQLLYIEGLNTATDAYYIFRNLKIEKGNKRTNWTPAPEDVTAEITSAKQEALTAAGNAQSTANSANTAVGNLSGYVDGAFKDGVIDAAEAKAIEKYKNTLNEAMAKAESSYLKVYTNTYLSGTPKTALQNAKINLWGQRDTLIGAINTAIAGGTTTASQKLAVDNAFTSFNSLMAAFQNALEDANKAIQVKLDDIAKVYKQEAIADALTATNTAKQEALTAAGNAQSTANSANTAVGNLSGYVDGAFKDGVIDAAEAKAIEKYKNTLNEAMAKAESSYLKVYTNTYLSGAPKTALQNAKINLWGQRDTLISAINTAIAGGTTTSAQKIAVDNAFGTFNNLMAAFQNALEEANKAIQVKLDDIAKGYVDDLEIGGQNLALETNQGTKNWHWSMQVGGFTATEHIEDGVSGCKLTRNSTPHSGWNFASYSKIGRDKLERGETYMITLDVFTNKASTLLLFFRTGNFQYELISSWDYKNNTCTANTWSRIVLKATLLQTFPPETNQLLYIEGLNTATDAYYIFRNLKIEKGNKRTTWTPSPEDVPSALDYIATAIEQVKGTTIEGGLVTTNLLMVKDTSGAFTGGMSGLSNDNVGFWTGGSYQDASDSLAKVLFRKDGSGQLARGLIKFSETGQLQVGDFDVDPGGTLLIKEGAENRVKITKSNIRTLNDIGSASQTINISNPPLDIEKTSNTTANDAIYLPNKITVLNSGTTLKIETIIRNHITRISGSPSRANTSKTQLTLYNESNNQFILIGSVSTYLDSLTAYKTTGKVVNTDIVVNAGVYRLILSVMLGYPGGEDNTFKGEAAITSTDVTGIYDTTSRILEIGNNGIGVIKDGKNYSFFGVENGVYKIVEKTTGVYDRPGVLLAGRMEAGAVVIGKSWGPKYRTGSYREGNNIYRIHHNIGHVDYSVQLTPQLDARMWVIQRATTYCRVQASAATLDFDFAIFGDNK